MVFCMVVLTLGFGTTIYLTRQEIKSQTDQKVNQSIGSIYAYVDDQLQRVEDIGYTFLTSFSGRSIITTSRSVMLESKSTSRVSELMTFDALETFLRANPHICGVALGFEDYVFPHTEGKYGFAAYVTNVGGDVKRINLGTVHNFKEREWYENAAQLGKACWSHPFRETSMGRVVACFSIPLYTVTGIRIGVLAIDIDTDDFHRRCLEVSPFPGAEVILCDSDFRIITHTNEQYLLKLVSEVEKYASYEADDSLYMKMAKHESGSYIVNPNTDHEAMFYFSPIPRTGWTITVECPSREIYKGLSEIRKTTTFISVLTLLLLFICMCWVLARTNKIVGAKASMENELNIAAKIQSGLLPKGYPAFPERNDLDIYGFLVPAKCIGGDLYDYVIRREKLFFCIGDVSGKGVPAGLFMSIVLSLFHSKLKETDDPAQILSFINNVVSERNPQNMFCTMILGVLDLKSGNLQYCNAGHNPPIIRRINSDKSSIDIHFVHMQTNLPLGVFPEFPYVKEETVLAHGEAIFTYTDGVSEAENANKELFGEAAIAKALAASRSANHLTSKEFVEAVYKAVRAHAGAVEQNDDITMLCMEYK